MNNQLISELELAASVIMAPPNLITNEQRRSAETVFLNFRKSKSPYMLCREILENSNVDYVLFEAAETLKTALIREWNYLEESDQITLRQYLIHYITSKALPTFVQDRLLQVVAIMVKRGSVDDFGKQRSALLREIEALIMGSDVAKQLLGCKLVLEIMREYMTTLKSTDVGLAWELHLRVKNQFEVTDLKRLFQFSVHMLSKIIENNTTNETLIRYLLQIAEGVLSWGFLSVMLPKRLIGVYETVFQADQTPCLRLTVQWSDIMFDPHLLGTMFQIYWKVRGDETLAHHAMGCLVQLATLNGAIMKSDEKLRYLTNYLENFLKLVKSIEVKNREALGVSNIIRKLQLFFTHDIKNLEGSLRESYFDEVTRLTICFCEGSAAEEANLIDDRYYTEAFENLLMAWTDIIQEYTGAPDTVLIDSSTRIFDKYLQVHLAPPHGTRHPSDDSDEIEDDEDNDRIRFDDQLETIGSFGRLILDHSLPLLSGLLETRTELLRAHLQTMQSRAMTISDANDLEAIFEDLHWVVLISGHVLCVNSEGETAMMLAEVTRYSIDCNRNGSSNLEATLKSMASVGRIGVAVDERCDATLRIVCDVLRLCEMEKSAAQVKLGQFMSPELGCSMMWFLKRFCLSYLLPVENYYEELSPILIGALGKDTEGAAFIINFVLSKIQLNICYFQSEPILLKDTVDLFVELVTAKSKATYVVKSPSLLGLIDVTTTSPGGSPLLLPPHIRRGLHRALTLAGAGLAPEDSPSYYTRVLTPLRDRFKGIQETFTSRYQDESVREQLADVLECLVGVACGAQMSTADVLFAFLGPILSEMQGVLGLYGNYQVIVYLVLELFCVCAKGILCYLSVDDGKNFYCSTLGVVKEYSKRNFGKYGGCEQEENNSEDLVLLLELLTAIRNKEILDLVDTNEEDGVTASDISIYGLTFVMPLMTVELLRYPKLCSQYYKLIVLLADINPEKICNLQEDILHPLTQTIHLGLTNFSTDITQACLDFLQAITTHIYKQSLREAPIHNILRHFLKLILELTLSYQIGSDSMNAASSCIYSLICCYREEYDAFVEGMVKGQADVRVAERLEAAFCELTRNVELDCELQPKLKFRDNFDRFIAQVHGFLIVK